MGPREDLKVGIGVPASVGLGVGILVGLGWRYTAPRLAVDADPPPLPPGATSYWIRLNFYEYAGGPSWWPTLLLAVIGLMLGVSAGMAGAAIGPGAKQAPLRSDGVVVVLAAGTAGFLTGLWGAAIAHWSPPLIGVINADGPRPDGYDEGAGYSGLSGAPPFWEIGPTWLWFPLIGAVIGLVASAAVIVRCSAARK
ncbi:hypothetical protein [Williamsia soli]|uniref:hypothetical protein n=1 Tax=Williamsia soli TaxID=364929 RepID=UPI001A9CEABD|nr:hypothetical protein [Williamsia soli]